METSWEGPFQVKSHVGEVKYVVQASKANLPPWVYYASSLKPYHLREAIVCLMISELTEKFGSSGECRPDNGEMIDFTYSPAFQDSERGD